MIDQLYRWLRLRTVKSRVAFWTSLLILVIGGSIVMLLYFFELRQYEAVAVRYLLSINQTQQDTIERWYEERRSDLRAVASLAAGLEWEPGSANDTLQLHVLGVTGFSSLNVADADGRIRIGTNRDTVSDVADSEHFRQARSGIEAVSYEEADFVTGRAAIVLATPIQLDDGQFDGAVIGAANVERLRRIMDKHRNWETERTYLVASDGRIVVGERADSAGNDVVSIADTELFRLLTSKPSETEQTARPLQDRTVRDFRGVDVFASAQWIADDRFLLIRTIDRAEVMQPAKQMVQLMLMLLIIGLVCSLGVTLRIAGHFVRPFEELQSAVRSTRKGKLEFQLQAPEGLPDEWKRLYETFETVASEHAARFYGESSGNGADFEPLRTEEDERLGGEDRYRAVFYRAGIGMAIVDSSGRFVEMNGAMEDILGFSAEELKRRRFDDFLHEQDVRDEDYNGVPFGSPFCVERRITHKNGSQIWARLTVTNLHSHSGDGMADHILMVEDVTLHKRALEALEESENLYRSLVDLSPDAVMVHIDGIFMYVNEKAVQMFGGKRVEDILFKPVLEFIEPAYHRQSVEIIRQLHANGKPLMNIDQRYMRLDGNVIDVELSASLVHYHNKQAILVLARDVTERKRNEEHIRQINLLLQKLSSTDGLTNIANRRAFDNSLEKEWRRAARHGSPLSLIMLDIDDFKPFNDTYGHQGGDQCLKEIAAVISGAAHREGDLAARYGGEEFVLLLPDTDEEGAALVAENIHNMVQQLKIPHASSDIAKVVTVSIGFTTLVPHPHANPQMLIDQADQALYMAKRNGRNQICRFT